MSLPEIVHSKPQQLPDAGTLSAIDIFHPKPMFTMPAVSEKPAALPASSTASLPKIYEQLDKRDALNLLQNPRELQRLFDANIKLLDKDGGGTVDKPELAAALGDVWLARDSRRVASALMFGYETLSTLKGTNDTVKQLANQFVPGFEGKSMTGISQGDIANFARTFDGGSQFSERMSRSFNAALYGAGAVATLFLLKDFAAVAVRSGAHKWTAPFEISGPLMKNAKELLHYGMVKGLARAIQGGTVAGVSAFSWEHYKAKSDNEKVNAMLAELKREVG